MNMKRLIIAIVALAGTALAVFADTEAVGGYTWTYQINGGTAERLV